MPLVTETTFYFIRCVNLVDTALGRIATRTPRKGYMKRRKMSLWVGKESYLSMFRLFVDTFENDWFLLSHHVILFRVLVFRSSLFFPREKAP